MNSLHLAKRGILPVQKLRILVQNGVISSDPAHPIREDQFQPNSIDLRLGEVAYRVRCGFLPENETVESKIGKLVQHSFPITGGAVLEPNCTYIIPLLEKLHLPKSGESMQKNLFNNSETGNAFRIYSDINISAKTNPKSTTGRLDIFTRLVTDYSHRFEEIAPGYQGPLFLEVVPKSFPVRIRTGQRLNQLRIRHGNSFVADDDLLKIHKLDPILLNESGEPIPEDKIKMDGGLFMSMNLHGKEGEVVGYKARKNRDLIDLEKIDHYKVLEFWDPICARQDDYLILEPEAFYIFASKERCRIPIHLAAEMVPYDTGSGELRTHYAGFFDSGFGGTLQDGGARAVLEVRSHDVPFLIEDGQTLFRMIFDLNTEIPDIAYGKEIKSNYQGQSLKLSKHFKSV